MDIKLSGFSKTGFYPSFLNFEQARILIKKKKGGMFKARAELFRCFSELRIFQTFLSTIQKLKICTSNVNLLYTLFKILKHVQ